MGKRPTDDLIPAAKKRASDRQITKDDKDSDVDSDEVCSICSSPRLPVGKSPDILDYADGQGADYSACASGTAGIISEGR